MKKALILALFLALGLALSVVSQAAAVITIYDNDRPGWESAVGAYEEEFFTDDILNPGVSVDTNFGYIDTFNGEWWDRLYCSEESRTIWQFDQPITAFGGMWNLAGPGGPGTGIEVATGDSWVPVGVITNDTYNEFWGFVSTIPFSKVRLTSDSSMCEIYPG